MTGSPYAVPAIVLITVATLAIGAFGYRISRNTSDFLVASRTVTPRWNASAISGEYLSAASLLGVAGLIMKFGVDMLWYPVGFTAGYLATLLFVAAPLRRSGAYTLPDFAEARLRSRRLRKLATGFVVLIGWLYLVPQLHGAGLTLSTVAGGWRSWSLWRSRWRRPATCRRSSTACSGGGSTPRARCGRPTAASGQRCSW